MTGGPGARVLVLALGRDPLPAAVTQAAQEWQGAGAQVRLLSLTPRPPVPSAAASLRLLARPAGADGVDPSTTGAPRSLPRKALRRLRLDPVRWVSLALTLASRQARAELATADLVLAADPASVPLGWVVARRRGPGVVLRSASGVGRALGSG